MVEKDPMKTSFEKWLSHVSTEDQVAHCLSRLCDKKSLVNILHPSLGGVLILIKVIAEMVSRPQQLVIPMAKYWPL